jgi:hypothetical protein
MGALLHARVGVVARWAVRVGLRPRTMRGWLRAGFGATLVLIATAGAVGVIALRDATARARSASCTRSTTPCSA